MRQRFLLALLCACTALPALAAAAETELEPYPLDYWALRPVINAAQVSPDGKYLGIMKIPAKDANPVIEVYEAAEVDKREPVFTLNADPMEITNFFWASDNDIIFYLRQKVRNRIEGFNQGVYETRLAIVDVESKDLEQFDGDRSADRKHPSPRPEQDHHFIPGRRGRRTRAEVVGSIPAARLLEVRPRERHQGTPYPRQDLARPGRVRRQRQSVARSRLRRRR